MTDVRRRDDTSNQWSPTRLLSSASIGDGVRWVADGRSRQVQVHIAGLAISVRLRAEPLKDGSGFGFSLETDSLQSGHVGGDFGFHLVRRDLFSWWTAGTELLEPAAALGIGRSMSSYRRLKFRAGDEEQLAEAVEVLSQHAGASWRPCLRSAAGAIPPSWSFAGDLPPGLLSDLDAVAAWAWPEGWRIEEIGTSSGGTFLAPLPLDVRIRPLPAEERKGWSAHEWLDRGTRLKAVADGIRAVRPKAAAVLDEAALAGAPPPPGP